MRTIKKIKDLDDLFGGVFKKIIEFNPNICLEKLNYTFYSSMEVQRETQQFRDCRYKLKYSLLGEERSDD